MKKTLMTPEFAYFFNEWQPSPILDTDEAD